MFILDATRIRHWSGDHLLFSIDKLHIAHKERIGVVGRNGAGKTTFLRLIAQEEPLQEGNLVVHGTLSWMRQEGNPSAGLSGGEETRKRLIKALRPQSPILLADEPTSHLDIDTTHWLEKELRHYPGTVILVSHDAALLNAVCTQILEINGGETRLYPGNYQAFLQQKQQLQHRKRFEYQQLEKEKKRLLEAARKKKAKASGMDSPPKRMSTSESRLYKAGKGSQIAKVHQQAKALETRIAQLGEKEKPVELPPIRLDVHYHQKIQSPIALRFEGEKERWPKRFHTLYGSIPTGAKVAVVGMNGIGKSTLLQGIRNGAYGKCSPQASIGFFHQQCANLAFEETILSNVRKESSYPESVARTLMAHLGFRGETIFKQVNDLSGGEKIKVLLAKIFLSNANLLLLDEPTNFLDIQAREEVTRVLQSYPGTILFASHDRKLISEVATHRIVLEKEKTMYVENTNSEDMAPSFTDCGEQLLLLQHELSDTLSRLSLVQNNDEKESLEKRYEEILQEIRRLKKRSNTHPKGANGKNNTK